MKIKKYKKGITLIEVLISMTMVLTVATVLTGAAQSALRVAEETLRKSESSKLAIAGLEAVTFYRNVNGIESLTEGCYKMVNVSASTVIQKVSNQITTCAGDIVNTPGNALRYNRKIIIDSLPDEKIEITSSVEWEDRTGTRQVKKLKTITPWK